MLLYRFLFFFVPNIGNTDEAFVASQYVHPQQFYLASVPFSEAVVFFSVRLTFQNIKTNFSFIFHAFKFE